MLCKPKAAINGISEYQKRIQLRVEFYNLLNHSNLYVNRNSNNLALASFNTLTASTPGVTASFGTPDRQPQEARQVVLALKLVF